MGKAFNIQLKCWGAWRPPRARSTAIPASQWLGAGRAKQGVRAGGGRGTLVRETPSHSAPPALGPVGQRPWRPQGPVPPPRSTRSCQQAALPGPRRRQRAAIDGRRPPPGSACGTEGRDLGGGRREFIAGRLPPPRRGDRLFSCSSVAFPEDTWGQAKAAERLWGAKAQRGRRVPRVPAPPAPTRSCPPLQKAKEPWDVLYFAFPGTRNEMPENSGLLCPLYLKIDPFSITQVARALVKTFEQYRRIRREEWESGLHSTWPGLLKPVGELVYNLMIPPSLTQRPINKSINRSIQEREETMISYIP